MLRSEWVGLEIDDRYTLLEWLGSTASGDAYLTALPDGRRAALLLAQADPANAQDQLRNWQRATELDHPHLLHAMACGRTDVESIDCLYLVTELPEEALAEILPERGLSADEVREMLEPVLEALNHLHEQNLLHGRLNPASILVAEGRLKLATDSIRPVGSLRGFDDVLVTYDAPESKSEPLSPASDIWSLGITLVEAFTQKPPAWVRSSGRDPLIPVTVPQPFAEIARRCLRTDPAQRCTVGEILSLLRPAVSEALPFATTIDNEPADPAVPETVTGVPTTSEAQAPEEPLAALHQTELEQTAPQQPAVQQAASADAVPPERKHAAARRSHVPAAEQLQMFEALEASEEESGAAQDSGSPFRRAMRGLDADDETAFDSKRYLQIGIAAAVILLLLIAGWAAQDKLVRGLSMGALK